ncbi:MAG TPA: hypothetical protein VD763_03225 [Candidatus Saccharimonadales bacterium]|nr:hypothetical protein [Candidatus Saccharimonadales bacterium]
MEQSTIMLLLVVAAAAGLIATLAILRRERHTTEATRESPFATATEGMKRCPSCGTANLVTDRDCSSCGKRLPG